MALPCRALTTHLSFFQLVSPIWIVCQGVYRNNTIIKPTTTTTTELRPNDRAFITNTNALGPHDSEQSLYQKPRQSRAYALDCPDYTTLPIFRLLSLACIASQGVYFGIIGIKPSIAIINPFTTTGLSLNDTRELLVLITGGLLASTILESLYNYHD